MRAVKKAKISKKDLENAIKQRINARSDDLFEKSYPFYFKKLKDNLISEMPPQVVDAYKNGAGKEFEWKLVRGKKMPPKMHALLSSSAMTFNIFGIGDKSEKEDKGYIVIKEDCALMPGKYRLQYEKQLKALKPNAPANLDVYLLSEKEILFFEMKMTEWIFDQPKTLRGSYLRNDNDYPDKTFCNVMQKLMWDYIPEEKRIPGKKEYSCKTKHFDAFQIMIHIFAIYKALHVNKFPDKYKKIDDKYKLPTQPKKITLVIGYWTVPEDNFLINNEDYDIYKKEMEGTDEEPQKDTMLYEINEFIEKLELKTIKNLFWENYKVTFDVKALTVEEIVACLDKKENELNALKKRYL